MGRAARRRAPHAILPTSHAHVPEHVVEANGHLYSIVVGSGPFRFVGYLPQTRLVLEKFDGYWGVHDACSALAYLDGITFIFYPDPTARTTVILTGDVDWSFCAGRAPACRGRRSLRSRPRSGSGLW